MLSAGRSQLTMRKEAGPPEFDDHFSGTVRDNEPKRLSLPTVAKQRTNAGMRSSCVSRGDYTRGCQTSPLR